MNILIIVRDFCSGMSLEKNGMPSKSGAEIHVERHAKEFIELGHRVTIMAKQRLWNTPLFERLADNFFLIRLPKIMRTLSAFGWMLFNLKRMDILYIFGLNSFSMTGILLAKLLNIPTVFVSTMTGEAFQPIKQDKYFPETWKPYRRMSNKILLQCSSYFAISREIADELIEHGINSNKVIYLPQGVNTSHFRPLSSECKEKLRASLQIPQNKTIVLFCSRLDTRKGFDILLNTWPRIAERNPHLHLLVVGGGPQVHIDSLNKMELELKSGGVTYVGEVSEPLVYYQCSDIFVFPSRREGLPNVLMEAMASGCACIASNIGGCRDVITHDETGFLFTVENKDEFYAEVCELANDPNKMMKIKEKSVEYCRKKLDVKIIAAQNTRIFEELT